MAVADGHFQRHHMRFTQRVDGRIGHLRETLLAIVPERTLNRGEESRGRIVSHAPIGFLAGQKGPEENFVLIVRPSGSAGNPLGMSNGSPWRFCFQMQVMGARQRAAWQLRRDIL